jgi:hypothetical protein
MLYKYIGEHCVEKFNGDFVVVDNVVYTNPQEEHLKMAGYKELKSAEIPEYNPESQYVEMTYKDGKNSITEICEIKDFPDLFITEEDQSKEE